MRRRVFLAGLALSPFLPARARAQSSSESFLLHTPVAPALFQKLRVWDTKEDEWRAPKPKELPRESAAVMVVHLWADYCGPCRQEFPVLRDLAKQIEARHKDRVAFVYLCETSSSTEAGRFFAENRASMPKGPHYQDTGEVIANLLRENIAGGQLSLPTTVVLDERRVIRQAIIGPITPHRGALAAGIGKLVQLAEGAGGRQSQP